MPIIFYLTYLEVNNNLVINNYLLYNKIKLPMIKRFIKRRKETTSYKNVKATQDVTFNNIEQKNNKDIMMPEQIMQAQELVDNMVQEPKVKRVKKEKGLMEKVTTDKVVIMEDNRQILND